MQATLIGPQTNCQEGLVVLLDIVVHGQFKVALMVGGIVCLVASGSVGADRRNEPVLLQGCYQGCEGSS
jgi:hypothetical protein